MEYVEIAASILSAPFVDHLLSSSSLVLTVRGSFRWRR